MFVFLSNPRNNMLVHDIFSNAININIYITYYIYIIYIIIKSRNL